jgi:hypothetical protein
MSSPNAPDQLPQISTLDPLLFTASPNTQSSCSTPSTNAPALTHLANNSRWLASYYGSRGDDHVRWNDGMRQNLDIFLNNGKGPDDDVVADVDV